MHTKSDEHVLPGRCTLLVLFGGSTVNGLVAMSAPVRIASCDTFLLITFLLFRVFR